MAKRKADPLHSFVNTFDKKKPAPAAVVARLQKTWKGKIPSDYFDLLALADAGSSEDYDVELLSAKDVLAWHKADEYGFASLGLLCFAQSDPYFFHFYVHGGKPVIVRTGVSDAVPEKWGYMGDSIATWADHLLRDVQARDAGKKYELPALPKLAVPSPAATGQPVLVRTLIAPKDHPDLAYCDFHNHLFLDEKRLFVTARGKTWVWDTDAGVVHPFAQDVLKGGDFWPDVVQKPHPRLVVIHRLEGKDRLRTIDARTEKEIAVIPAPAAKHQVVHPDGKRLFVATSDNKASYLDIDTLKVLATSPFDPPIGPNSFGSGEPAFTPDGRRLLYLTYDFCTVFDANTLQILHQFDAIGTTAAFSPDSRYVAVGRNAPIDVRDIETGKRVVRLKKQADSQPLFGVNSSRVWIFRGEPCSFTPCDLPSGKPGPVTKFPRVAASDFVFTPSRRRMALPSGDAIHIIELPE